MTAQDDSHSAVVSPEVGHRSAGRSSTMSEHPLSDAAMATLRRLADFGPEPKSEVNPGVGRRAPFDDVRGTSCEGGRTCRVRTRRAPATWHTFELRTQGGAFGQRATDMATTNWPGSATATNSISAILASSPKATEPFRDWIRDCFCAGFGSAPKLVDAVVLALRMGHSTDVAVDLLRAAVAEGWITRCSKEDRGTILPRMRKAGYAVSEDLCYGYEPARGNKAALAFIAASEATQ